MSVRILDNNFLILENLSNIFVSSEQAAFPVENALNLNRRSKIWRSNGYWNITASNNEIIFRESIGVDLTATIPVAEYNSSLALFAAIKAALELAGASTYTVLSDSTTLKVYISSNGFGGGGIFQIDWPNSSMASILGFSTASEDTGALSYLADELRIATSEWITFDFGLSALPTAFCLIGSRNKPIKLTPTAVIKLQGNETDSWATPNSEVSLTYDSSVISSFNAVGLYDEALRYSRIYFEDLSNPEGYIEVGALFLGTYFSSTRGQVQFPFRSEYIDNSKTSFSEGGQTYSDIREKSEVFTIEWYGLTISEFESINSIWDAYGLSLPFFIQFDPSQNFSSSASRMIRYVKFASTPSYELVSPGNFSVSMVLREEL